jgi:hypothetical protein
VGADLPTFIDIMTVPVRVLRGLLMAAVALLGLNGGAMCARHDLPTAADFTTFPTDGTDLLSLMVWLNKTSNTLDETRKWIAIAPGVFAVDWVPPSLLIVYTIDKEATSNWIRKYSDVLSVRRDEVAKLGANTPNDYPHGKPLLRCR